MQTNFRRLNPMRGSAATTLALIEWREGKGPKKFLGGSQSLKNVIYQTVFLKVNINGTWVVENIMRFLPLLSKIPNKIKANS